MARRWHGGEDDPVSYLAAGGTSSAGLIGAIISGAFLAAMLAGAVNVWMARRRSREEERARIRNTFAAAFEAYTAYKEFPYAIRRRRPDEPEGERIRLSEALRAVQEKVNCYLAWTRPSRLTSASCTPSSSARPVGSPVGPCMTPGTTRPGPQTLR
jgi:hypothetical protein